MPVSARPRKPPKPWKWGADAVLANTAVATAEHPAVLAEAFALAVKAGRLGYLSQLPDQKEIAQASSPLTGFLYDQP